MNLDLDDDETTELIRALREIVDFDPYPLSPRVRCLKAVLTINRHWFGTRP